MSKSRAELAGAMKRLFDALGGLTDEEVSKLLDDSYSVEIKLVRRRGRDEGESGQKPDLSEVIARISGCKTREEAQQFLDSSWGSRKALESVARGLDIPILKQDKVDTLRDKIIEATVGARIRSQAIQRGS